jgi:hypothetical protein
LSSKPVALLGWRPIAAKTCGKRSAASSAAWHECAVGADREHPVHALALGLRDEVGVVGRAAVEVGVAVDHVPAATSRFGKSGSSDSTRSTRGTLAERPQAAVLDGQRVEQRAHALGQVGQQERGDHAQALDERGERAVERLGVRLVLGELPRRLLLDEEVQPAHALPDRLERVVDRERVHRLADRVGQRRELRGEGVVERARGTAPSR